MRWRVRNCFNSNMCIKSAASKSRTHSPSFRHKTWLSCILLFNSSYYLPSLWQNQRGRSGFQTGERFVAYLSKTLLVFFAQFHSTFMNLHHKTRTRTATHHALAHSHIRHTRPQSHRRADALLIDAHIHSIEF